MTEDLLQLPKNIEAEQVVLGIALLEAEDALPVIQEKLKPEHFYQRAHRLIYRTLCELFDHGKLADVVTVANRLKEKDEMQHAGGRLYLNELLDHVTTATSIEHYCDIVLKKASLRALIESGRRISELGRQEEQDTDDLQDKALSILSDTITADTGDKILHIQEAGQSFMEKLDAVRAGKPLGTMTGYSSLDKVLYGLEGKLTVIGGYTSSGKTCLQLNMAYRQVTKGIPVGFISVEMGRDPIMERLIQMEGHLTRDNLRYGSGKKVAEAASRIYGKPLYIVDVHSNSLMAIVRQMRQLLMRHRVEVIYVDYLQKVRVPNWTGQRYREVGEVSNMLQEFARVSGIGVVTGSQVSRESLQMGGPPKLQHMRESGNIENDSDIIIGLFNPKIADSLEENKRIRLEVLKHREGLRGNVLDFAYFESQQRIEELTLEGPKIASLSL